MRKYYFVSKEFLKYVAYFAFNTGINRAWLAQKEGKDIDTNEMSDEYEKEFEERLFGIYKENWSEPFVREISKFFGGH